MSMGSGLIDLWYGSAFSVTDSCSTVGTTLLRDRDAAAPARSSCWACRASSRCRLRSCSRRFWTTTSWWTLSFDYT